MRSEANNILYHCAQHFRFAILQDGQTLVTTYAQEPVWISRRPCTRSCRSCSAPLRRRYALCTKEHPVAMLIAHSLLCFSCKVIQNCVTCPTTQCATYRSNVVGQTKVVRHGLLHAGAAHGQGDPQAGQAGICQSRACAVSATHCRPSCLSCFTQSASFRCSCTHRRRSLHQRQNHSLLLLQVLTQPHHRVPHMPAQASSVCTKKKQMANGSIAAVQSARAPGPGAQTGTEALTEGHLGCAGCPHP